MAEQNSALGFDMDNIPEVLPVLPLHEIVLFPKMALPLVVMHAQSIQLIDDVMSKDRMIGFISSKQPTNDNYFSPSDLYEIGTSAFIAKMAKSYDDKVQLLVQGLKRFKVKEFVETKPFLKAHMVQLEDLFTNKEDKQIRALVSNLLEQFDKIIKLSPMLPQEISSILRTITEPGTLADMVISIVNVSLAEKQKVLEILDVKDRLTLVTRLINDQLEILEIGSKIQTQVKEDMDNKQKEFYLRQQLQIIKNELGEKDESNVEIEEYREKIKALQLPEEAQKEADRELKRFSKMHPSSSEYTVSSTYLDWITSMPWKKFTEDMLDIHKAREILDEDHYGLAKAKKRIVEYLAVRKLNPESKGVILCFVGPPGTGKTSLGRSIARAIQRKFVRISLGGIRDEAEIRGHRRTYVGALPGRIIQGIRRAESNNPVFVLDEIDKIGTDFRGDPSAALLEVLDPEQNNTFVDHYLDVPYDLSKVMFITTANVLHTVPHALLDRMEIIELSGYTLEEKLMISKRYLIKRQLKEHGLKAKQLQFSTSTIKYLIESYTREAGLRQLDREIASICRAAACQIAENKTNRIVLKPALIHSFLGPFKYTIEVSSRISTPGVVMGLSWTPSGGDLLFIEATAMKGKKGLTLTGQLGDVMKESATTALSFIRTNAASLKINDNFFEEFDIHIHVPAGAIPKDGPSAGVTMLCALTSLLTGRLIKKDIAMTGEITLRGQVLPVGGIKEKILAAHRAKIKTVILPKGNEKDMEDIPKQVKDEIKFCYVEKMMELIKHALEKKSTQV
ncbi:MAG: endopeptidase La [Desulfobacterales bacterium]|nr:endopeptidase La [Desulfobacterales bacterium]